MSSKNNKIEDLLIKLGLCEKSSICPYYPRVRDSDNISVLRCKNSGVIFLSQTDHMDLAHYEDKEEYKYHSSGNRKQVVNDGIEDLQRRKALLQNIIVNKKWIDIGTGSGGILDALSPLARETFAVEPQKYARQALEAEGYISYPSIQDITGNDYEVITLFHVFEHFTNPIEDLKTIYQKMSDSGMVVIEVPHANDFLISFLEHDSFKKFTFWSEHLILHTRQSLQIFLEEAGFVDIVITGCQRYPLANHLHWLVNNKPGGHRQWHYLRTEKLDSSYAEMLGQIDKTDTLIAFARK